MQQIDFVTALGELTTPDAGESKQDRAFQRLVLRYFKLFGRAFPWRETKDPYRILVSEVMLQQTQTERVVPKYEQFLEAFPTWHALAEAPQVEVLKLWAGLGYYRRARNLQRAAQAIVTERGGAPPTAHADLLGLPGVGPYTAAAVAAFAFDEPVSMIETNIRTVYLHAYFKDQVGVTDRALAPIIDRTLYLKDPRSWFYALMDLGAFMKRHVKGVNQRSAHYSRQSPFKGSHRQARAAVLKIVTEQGVVPVALIEKSLEVLGVHCSTERIKVVLEELCDEGFMVRERNRYRVA
jgi:A/G-specific adenine glycosylase